jgi:hypothetical protein
MQFLSDIGVRISFSVQKWNFYLLEILQPFYCFLNLLLLGTSHTEAKENMTFSNKCKLSFELYSGEILLQPRTNSAVTDKRLHKFCSFCVHLSEGQLDVKVLQLVSYPIYFARMTSSFQYIIPQSRWDWSKHPCCSFSSHDRPGNFSQWHFSFRNRITRNEINRLINMSIQRCLHIFVLGAKRMLKFIYCYVYISATHLNKHIFIWEQK